MRASGSGSGTPIGTRSGTRTGSSGEPSCAFRTRPLRRNRTPTSSHAPKDRCRLMHSRYLRCPPYLQPKRGFLTDRRHRLNRPPNPLLPEWRCRPLRRPRRLAPDRLRPRLLRHPWRRLHRRRRLLRRHQRPNPPRLLRSLRHRLGRSHPRLRQPSRPRHLRRPSRPKPPDRPPGRPRRHHPRRGTRNGASTSSPPPRCSWEASPWSSSAWAPSCSSDGEDRPRARTQRFPNDACRPVVGAAHGDPLPHVGAYGPRIVTNAACHEGSPSDRHTPSLTHRKIAALSCPRAPARP